MHISPLDLISPELIHFDRPARKFVVAIAFLGKSRYIGLNEYRSHPAMKIVKASGVEVNFAHAETLALSKIPRQSRRNVRLYVCRVQKDYTFTMARPCNACTAYLKGEGVDLRNVVYTDWHGNWMSLR